MEEEVYTCGCGSPIYRNGLCWDCWLKLPEQPTLYEGWATDVETFKDNARKIHKREDDRK
jgi:hypothetical protein